MTNDVAGEAIASAQAAEATRIVKQAKAKRGGESPCIWIAPLGVRATMDYHEEEGGGNSTGYDAAASSSGSVSGKRKR